MMFCTTGAAQNVTATQNQQVINLNVPVIEKKVYVDRYRTVYVEKPRVARKLEKPVLLLGYLWVYPEDLGNFGQIPVGVINSVNAQRPYGRNNWRIPTPDELAVLEANAEKIGLGDDIYLATDHRNGVLRLVAVDDSYNNCVLIGNTYWSKTNLGASSMYSAGRLVTYEQAVKFCPEGWRLPTKDDFEELINSGKACFGNSRGCSLYFPFQVEGRETLTRFYDSYGDYWLKEDDNNSTNKANGFSFSYEERHYSYSLIEKSVSDPEICHPYKDEKRCVRYVKIR